MTATPGRSGDSAQRRGDDETTTGPLTAGEPEILSPERVEAQRRWLHDRGTDKLLRAMEETGDLRPTTLPIHSPSKLPTER